MRYWITNGIVLLSCAAVIDLAFFEFLPSAAFYQYNLTVALVTVAGTALLFALNWGKWTASLEMQRKDQPPSWWRDSPGLLTVFAVAMAVWLTHAVTMRLVPHLIVAAKGESGAQEFVVDSLTSNRLCRRGVTLVGPPFGSDRLCGLSRKFRKSLGQGSMVVVYGKQNWAGLIPQAVKRK